MVTHGSLLLLSVKEVIAQVVIRRGRGGKLTSKTKWPAERERACRLSLYQIGYVHGHLLNGGVVERFNVP